MTADERRNEIKSILLNASAPLSASKIANKFSVTRQIIVGDIALLRAAGYEIYATPRGYVYDNPEICSSGYEKIIACRHTTRQMKDELYAVVDNGAQMINVTVEHSLYGQISAPLLIASRYDADEFIKKLARSDARPLSDLTDGVHLHKIKCPDTETATRIEQILLKKGILFPKE